MKNTLSLAFCILLTGCATNADIENMKQSITKRLDTVENQMSNQKLVELYRKVEDTHEKVIKIEGDIELIQQDIENTKKRQDDFYADLDSRISETKTSLPTSYEEAIKSIQKRDFNQALILLKSIIDQLEQKKRAPETYFWVGISYTGLGKFDQAITAYQKFVEENPNHKRVPDALLNIANCQQFLGQEPQKAATLAKLLKHYPNSDAAKQLRLAR